MTDCAAVSAGTRVSLACDDSGSMGRTVGLRSLSASSHSQDQAERNTDMFLTHSFSTFMCVHAHVCFCI